MSDPATPKHRVVNLALQGGGSHGAFTWGVLDALLSDGRLRIEGISGTSAGAFNAAALASGHARALAAGSDPATEARAALTHLWTEVIRMGHASALSQNLVSLLWSGVPSEYAPTNMMAATARHWLSPYQTNPLDINPLRDLLSREIDFSGIARLESPRVFVTATQVRTGKAVLFSGQRLSAQAVMASACLPMLFQAQEIDGEPYWDGGYGANPALMPLVDHCTSADIVLVQINPVQRDVTPRTPAQIMDRVNELTFNASLMAQMREIDFINRLIAEGWLQGQRCRSVLLHRIDGGAAMKAYPASSRSVADEGVIRSLFELGQVSGRHWLERHFDDLGQRTTIDIRQDYLDDTRVDSVQRAGSSTPVPRRGLRSLIAGLFRRTPR